jgi:hypothetical protein
MDLSKSSDRHNPSKGLKLRTIRRGNYGKDRVQNLGSSFENQGISPTSICRYPDVPQSINSDGIKHQKLYRQPRYQRRDDRSHRPTLPNSPQYRQAIRPLAIPKSDRQSRTPFSRKDNRLLRTISPQPVWDVSSAIDLGILIAVTVY